MPEARDAGVDPLIAFWAIQQNRVFNRLNKFVPYFLVVPQIL